MAHYLNKGAAARVASGQTFVVKQGQSYVARITADDKGWATGGLFWHSDPARALRFNGDLESVTFDTGRISGTLAGWLDAKGYSDGVRGVDHHRFRILTVGQANAGLLDLTATPVKALEAA